MIWCSIIVTLMVDGTFYQHETAAKGKIIKETQSLYFVDFSDYASQHEYIGAYSYIGIDKDNCLKEERSSK